MFDQLNQEKLLLILKEVQKLGENNQNLTSKDVVAEIERLLLNNSVECFNT
ncbi:MAG: hypothetical protein ACK4M9_14125 [Anaerobacillus sp.]|uniref:hypothetical protein n=1 Tax=Anaerobacillus sp. TaxID=1872506 RepID=UPI003919AD7D